MTDKFEGHTPGPWVWENNVRLWNEETVFYVLGTSGLGGVSHLYFYEQADKDLIAAAPDLLAENKKLREALETIKDYKFNGRTSGIAKQALLNVQNRRIK